MNLRFSFFTVNQGKTRKRKKEKNMGWLAAGRKVGNEVAATFAIKHLENSTFNCCFLLGKNKIRIVTEQ